MLSLEARQAGSRFLGVRGATEALASGLTPEDCIVQSMPDASPVKWHLAHTSWFFETFLLAPNVVDYRPFRDEYAYLFNSYYESIGPRQPRPERGMLTRPPLDEVIAYRRHVNDAVVRLLSEQWPLSPGALAVLEMGLQHEQQHQELILTDLKHLLSRSPLKPAYRSQPMAIPAKVKPIQWFAYSEGVRRVGHVGDGFHFDNEAPAHRQFMEPFEIASRLITNGEYLEFIEAGGYRRPDLWMADGWAAVQAGEWSMPLYWQQDARRWLIFTLSGLQELDLDEPVCHVNWFEADAYARFLGARLPTEAEWEVAALDAAQGGNFAESGRLHPAPVQSALRADWGPAQLFGDVWEWTGSAYLPYPGYAPAAGALGEYNGKFMVNQFVLRGGSCATPQSHIRATYRNFFPPHARWQFSGIRLARSPR
ncbi:MAG: ergothioneine biosynthesis protein EgtB [Betaproteobacteria bacterium]